jgi:hypothetical protein
MVIVRPKLVFLLAIAICGGLFFSCRGAVGHNPSGYSDALISYPGAKDVKFFEQNGTTQLIYEVEAKFPASGLIGRISYELEEKGWQALTYDYLNPDLPSSQVQGWTKFIDATKPTEQIVHQWLGDWKDDSENIVRYAFRYGYPKDGAPNLTDLEVSAIYIPAALAKQGQEAVGKFKETLKPR